MSGSEDRNSLWHGWNRHVKDSASYGLGQAESLSDYFRRLRARYDILGGMEATRKHVNFYTHTNPYGCPWCELFVVAGLAIKNGEDLAAIYEQLQSEIAGEPREPEEEQNL